MDDPEIGTGVRRMRRVLADPDLTEEDRDLYCLMLDKFGVTKIFNAESLAEALDIDLAEAHRALEVFQPHLFPCILTNHFEQVIRGETTTDQVPTWFKLHDY